MVQSKHYKAGKVFRRLHFSTLSLKCLNDYHFKFYRNGRKIIPKNIDSILISPLSLAVWFMDDGYKRNDCNALRISTDSFNHKEQLMLVECLQKNFNIKCRLHKKAQTWNIYIPESSSIRFCALIKSYIIPSMRYKINLTP